MKEEMVIPMNRKIVNDMISFIDKSPSPYHVILNMKGMLSGFAELKESEEWKLEKGGKYFCIRKDSSIVIFNIPEELEDIRLVAAHSDSPSFKVKPHGDELSNEYYTRLNTEGYGGMLMAQWLDRPLGVAGRIIVKDGDEFKTILVDSEDDTCLIPSVAIHMNREVNKGYQYDLKCDTIPLYGNSKSKGSLLKRLLEDTDYSVESVLGHDLFLYNRERGRVWGAEQEFVSSRALDDLECAYTAVRSVCDASVSDKRMRICCIFDNEEVGSTSNQGADSNLLSAMLIRIREAAGYKESDILRGLAAGYLISADNGHAIHPNHPEYADALNKPVMNGGIVIKYQAGQKYTTDAYSEAIIRDICAGNDIPVQEYTNRSDLPGGSTLGNILNSHVSVRTVDIGLAQLAMHSPYETAGTEDVEYLYRMFKAFWEL